MIGTILDIETTGFLSFDTITLPNPAGYGEPIQKSQLSDNCEILEVGFINIDIDSAKMLSHGTLYFYKPYFHVESDAQRIHGLTRDFLQQFEQDFEKNLIALNALMQNAVIIGKNSTAFDIPVIKAFLEKHGGIELDIKRTTTLLNMKGYNGGYVSYGGDIISLDMQTFYKERFHELYMKKYGLNLTPNMTEVDVINEVNRRFPNAGQYGIEHSLMMLQQAKVLNMNKMAYPDEGHPALTSRKKGSLEQYIDVIDNALMVVDALYGQLTKQRVSGYHSALYDAVMTYVVWYDAKLNGIFEKGAPNEV